MASSPLAAAAFLTRLPLRASSGPEEVARAAMLFPLVGAALGALVGAVAWGLAFAVPASLAGAAAVAVELALTGALHVDGLADSADGLGARGRERALAAMRDHTVGAYGASALALALLAKATALGALAEAGDVAAVAAALGISRAAPLPLAAALPSASDGLGRTLTDRIGWRHAGAAVLLAAATAAALVGSAALALVACLAVVATAVGMLARRRLGGVTGDVMGAAVELTAVAALAVATATA